MRDLRGIARGSERHPWRLVGYIFASLGAIFMTIRLITHFFPTTKIEGAGPLMAIVLISVCYGLYKIWEPSKIEIPIATCNTFIEVLFGDLFQQDGIRAITVSEYFESKLGKPVSETSVHGAFLKNCFGGHPETFDAQVDDELKNVQYQQVNKVEGKTKRYPIGTTAVITVNKDIYIAFAVTTTDPITCKVSSDVHLLWEALGCLWQRARIEAGGRAVNLPLVGSGASGTGLPTRNLLDLMILSIITETKVKEITKRIRIVLNPDRVKQVDLADVLSHWREC
jgi:hypothetical protein